MYTSKAHSSSTHTCLALVLRSCSTAPPILARYSCYRGTQYKCLALRQHQKESVQMQMVMIPPWTFLTNSNVVDIDQIVTTSILSHTSWTHSQGNLFLLLTDIRVTPQDNTHLGPGGSKGIFYGPYLTTAVTRHVLSANAQLLYPFLCLCTASSNPYSLLCRIYTFVHLYTFVPRFVPPDVHTPKYTLILHNYSTTSRFPKIDTEFGSYERKCKSMKTFWRRLRVRVATI